MPTGQRGLFIDKTATSYLLAVTTLNREERRDAENAGQTRLRGEAYFWLGHFGPFVAMSKGLSRRQAIRATEKVKVSAFGILKWLELEKL